MKVIMLGTSSGTPTKERNVSSLAIFINGHWLLFDCGEGTQYRLLRAPVRLGQLDAIFLTHVHGDHIFGLPGLLATLSMQHRPNPLYVYGPRGIKDFITMSLKLSVTRLSYELKITEVEAGIVRKADGYTVNCLPLDHQVLDFGYAVIENDHPGKFDLEKARALGIAPGPLYGKLQSGQDIILEDGREIKSSDIVGLPRKGRKVVYCTDTRPCQNSVELARNADLLIHESTYAEDLAEEAPPRGHSTAIQAATIAEKAQVERLLITHFSPRYLDNSVLLSEARSIFPNTDAARDFLEVEVSRKE
ncbi:MAG: ribonuclease Z [Acidobacteria bacterium]|nr:ribonuclease Z [Acidobacteriota bacterium]